MLNNNTHYNGLSMQKIFQKTCNFFLWKISLVFVCTKKLFNLSFPDWQAIKMQTNTTCFLCPPSFQACIEAHRHFCFLTTTFLFWNQCNPRQKYGGKISPLLSEYKDRPEHTNGNFTFGPTGAFSIFWQILVTLHMVARPFVLTTIFP